MSTRRSAIRCAEPRKCFRHERDRNRRGRCYRPCARSFMHRTTIIAIAFTLAAPAVGCANSKINRKERNEEGMERQEDRINRREEKIDEKQADPENSEAKDDRLERREDR